MRLATRPKGQKRLNGGGMESVTLSHETLFFYSDGFDRAFCSLSSKEEIFEKMDERISRAKKEE